MKMVIYKNKLKDFVLACISQLFIQIKLDREILLQPVKSLKMIKIKCLRRSTIVLISLVESENLKLQIGNGFVYIKMLSSFKNCFCLLFLFFCLPQCHGKNQKTQQANYEQMFQYVFCRP